MMHGQPYHSIDFFAVANVTRKRQRSIRMAHAGARSFDSCCVAGQHNYIGAVLGEKLGYCFAYSHGCACYHYNFPSQIRFHEGLSESAFEEAHKEYILPGSRIQQALETFAQETEAAGRRRTGAYNPNTTLFFLGGFLL
jgi:hypothetical protein